MAENSQRARSLGEVGEFFFAHEFKVHVTVYKKTYIEDMEKIVVNPHEVLSTEFMPVEMALKLSPADTHPQLKPCLELLRVDMQKVKL